MKTSPPPIAFEELASAVPVRRGQVDPDTWVAHCAAVREGGGRLVALWGADERAHSGNYALHACLAERQGLTWLTLALNDAATSYPSLHAIFPAAARMQRAVRDLLGLQAHDAPDSRPWLRHNAWGEHQFPLRKDFDAATAVGQPDDGYPFVPVSGDGVHEIAVGPVHAGTIEPGHFRFSVVGEKVLRLEERLGYTHKGIEKRFEGLSVEEAAPLAGRISGDSTSAYAWAYAMAVESAAGISLPARGVWLRALLLERERMANHLGDLGALGNDAGLAFGLAQFSRLKENALRANQAIFGHRYAMDAICPGGSAVTLDGAGASRLLHELNVLEDEVRRLKHIYDEHAGLQDRLLTTGRVTPALAAQLGLSGLAGRASGQAWDLRVQFPHAPYDQLDTRMTTHRAGDVAARVTVRMEELLESLRLCRLILHRMPPGPVAVPCRIPPGRRMGVGWVEGWRGEVLVALTLDDDGRIERLHAHDPSWQNWPALEHAIMGNIVPDFLLINKSFNLSYSGHDL